MTEDKQWKELAAQLRCPSGDKATETGNQMNEGNITMTFHSIELLNLCDDETVLELGHGNCAHLVHLMKTRNITYYGLEISEAMQKEAQQINATFVTEKKAVFELYNGINIPFSDAFFDKMFTVNTVYFWSEPLKLLSEIYRVLKPAGIANITFVQGVSMKQLPFVEYGFELYDTEKIQKLAASLPLKTVQVISHTEKVKSKAGTLINREFTTVTFQKTNGVFNI